MIYGLPDKLKLMRIQNKLSQQEVADRIDVAPATISAYETGERTPSTEILLALSYLYQCSTDYLLGKITEPPTVVLNTTGLNEEQIQALQYLIRVMKQE